MVPAQRQPPDLRKHPKPPFPALRLPKPGIEANLTPAPQWQAPDYRAAGKLEGKIALVTGGDSGSGRAVAVLYAREDADVAINFLTTEAVDAKVTAAAVRACGRRCLLLPGDLGRSGVCDRIVERTVRSFGALDVLVSNAAHQNHKRDLSEVKDAEFDRTFQVNIYAYFRLARAALRHMKPGAAIIATSSVTGLLGSAELPDYSATKGAINANDARPRAARMHRDGGHRGLGDGSNQRSSTRIVRARIETWSDASIRHAAAWVAGSAGDDAAAPIRASASCTTRVRMCDTRATITMPPAGLPSPAKRPAARSMPRSSRP
ncbi:MAG: SDR family NAD(P)-dependent oxidoreductase [Betaproteobacteria bacterium]